MPSIPPMLTRERSQTTFEIASYEVDLTRSLSLFSLFNRFQDLAGIHAEYLQVGYDLLQKSKLAWVLSRIKVHIRSLPRWGDTVQLATWPKGVDRLFAIRDFSVASEKGETLILATSAWLLIDIEKNRPQRIENLPIDLQFPGAVDAIKERPDKIQMPVALEPVFARPVWLSDIDTNQHVNNAQYAKWISDCFSENQYRNRRITSMQINYLEEALRGDTVELLKTPNDDLAGEYYVGGFSRTRGSSVFKAKISWA
jgi:medium-chain acyl-[acyl-carrier-protein] hydrolase